uniref:Leishmanolysin-like peptidase n=1 Tax=Schistosoma mansoni TaxID=6183 RepID=A0A5K4FD50_SCHMA
MKIYIFVFVCIVLLQWVIGEHDQSAVQESQVGQLVQPQTLQKRSFINKQLRIILLYDEDLKQSKMFSKIKGFHPSVYESKKFTSAKPPSVQNISLSWLSTKGTYEVQKTILSLPKMLKEAREHFDCQELQGIELDGTVFSQRIMGNDLMTRFQLESSRVSRITLAYFEDINMYEVDYSMADDFKWGKGLGCDFVLKSCYEYIKERKSRGQDIQPYCDIPSEQKCASYENGIGTCALYKHKNQLNEVNQYMDDSFTFTDTQKEKYGGYSFFDYCPVLVVHSYEKDESSLCDRKSDLEPDSTLDLFLDYRGPDSACFMDETIEYVSGSKIYTAKNTTMCHKFQCSKNYGVEVIFNGQLFECPVEGGIIHIRPHMKKGYLAINIQCPKCTSLCKNHDHNDLMTPYQLESSCVSRITLAYFEDINMYEVDYSMADDFKWGKGLGCDFVLKSCYEYIKERRSRGQDIHPYCDIPFEQKCDSYENGIGTCALFKHENQLNESNQYMDDSFAFTDTEKEKYGGYPFLDHCPVLLVLPHNEVKSSLCEKESGLEPDSTLDTFLDYRGPDSACFMGETFKYFNVSKTYTVEKKPSCHKVNSISKFR